MKKLSIVLFMLTSFFTCFSYDYKAAMDDYFDNCQKNIYDEQDRAERREAQRQEAETNRAIQRELSPVNSVNKYSRPCPG